MAGVTHTTAFLGEGSHSGRSFLRLMAGPCSAQLPMLTTGDLCQGNT